LDVDQLEMEGALELFLAQYDAKIDAENEFLDRLEETILERAGPCDYPQQGREQRVDKLAGYT